MNLQLVPVRNTQLQKIAGDTDQNFEQVVESLKYVEQVVAEHVNTTAASVSRYLPDGESVQLKQYRYVKIDASANTVTIYPYTGQTIMNAASYVLAARYDRIWLTFCKETQDWLPVSP